MEIVGYIKVTYIFHELKDRWTGYCKELGTATFGKSFEDAVEKLEEAVICHLNTLEDLGECERFFEEHSITYYTARPKEKEVEVRVPYDPKVVVQPRIQPFRATCASPV